MDGEIERITRNPNTIYVVEFQRGVLPITLDAVDAANTRVTPDSFFSGAVAISRGTDQSRTAYAVERQERPTLGFPIPIGLSQPLYHVDLSRMHAEIKERRLVVCPPGELDLTVGELLKISSVNPVEPLRINGRVTLSGWVAAKQPREQ